MARNKYPEETLHKILAVSYQLFQEKGYEETSIQDIVDALGMSKGAVYHHFKSKEDILYHIGGEAESDLTWIRAIIEKNNSSGLEKIRALFLHSLTEPKKLSLDRLCHPLQKNPRLVAHILEGSVQTAPILARVIEQGNRDGSTHVAAPLETSEALLILVNTWLGLFSETREQYHARLLWLKHFTDSQGLPLADEPFLDICMKYYDTVMYDANV